MSVLARNREELSIIVVDDMKFNCEFIRKSLRDEGYHDVRVAISAQEALAQLAERPAEVLLADWVMPEMDGLELTDRVRQIDEEKNRYTCVLLLTARDDIASVIEAFDRGVDDYLTKPPNKQELAARIYAAGRIANLQNGLLDAMEVMREGYERRVTIDQATGLGNRLDAERRFAELLGIVSSRGGVACCGFISLNEGAALQAQLGDEGYCEMLKSIATRLRRSVRPNDVVARVSDTEFVIGMLYQDEEQVRAKTFRRILQEINVRSIKTSRGFVTASAAMSVTSSHKGKMYEGAEQMMEVAAHGIETARASGGVLIDI